MASTTTDYDKKALACRIAAWSISVIVSAVAIIAWGQSYQWHVTPVSNYLLFPLLGLLAFSLMWAHYAAGFIREMAGVKSKDLGRYFLWTSYAVLVLICLHPGLLIYQLFADGRGLPPFSYERYVGPGLGWITLLGTVSLLVFLAFELHRVYGDRSWWKYVAGASDVAMLAIIYHGLRLGSQLQTGWFKYVWYFYAVVFVAILVRKYFLIFRKSPA